MVQKEILNYSMSRMKLLTSKPLGVTGCSELELATAISTVSGPREMVQKGALVYSLSWMKPGK